MQSFRIIPDSSLLLYMVWARFSMKFFLKNKKSAEIHTKYRFLLFLSMKSL